METLSAESEDEDDSREHAASAFRIVPRGAGNDRGRSRVEHALSGAIMGQRIARCAVAIFASVACGVGSVAQSQWPRLGAT